MSQEVLYRKWRPGTFGDVAGQDPIATTLRNVVAAASPAHAYLFTGPRGTGKTSTGRILAKAVNCEAPVAGEPCNGCASCQSFNEGRALDLIELDAASNRGIDEVRALRESVGYAPNSARYKVYLIDEVHMLTDAAFNALLKTLEEPPPHVIFVLATTEAHRIPPTVSSRCQRFDFRRGAVPSIVDVLKAIADGEEFVVDAAGFELIARQSGGSFRDAVNLLDQLVAYNGRTLDIDAVRRGLGLVADDRATALARAAIERDLPAGLALLGSVSDDGIKVRAFVREVVNTLRALLLLKAGAREELGLSDAQVAELLPVADGAQASAIVAALRVLGEINFAGDAYDALPAEIAFASLAVGLPEERDALAGAPAVQAADPAPVSPAAAAEPPGRARQRAPAERPPRPPRPRAATAQRRNPTPVPDLPDETPPSPELEALRQRWGEIRDTARAQHYKAGALLNSRCYIKSFEGDSVEVGFQSTLLVERALGDAEILSAIHNAVSVAVGRPVEVVPVVWEALQSGPPQGPTSAPPATAEPSRGSGGHLVDEARKLGAVPIEE